MEARAERYTAQQNSLGAWCVIDRKTGQVVGRAGGEETAFVAAALANAAQESAVVRV